VHVSDTQSLLLLQLAPVAGNAAHVGTPFGPKQREPGKQPFWSAGQLPPEPTGAAQIPELCGTKIVWSPEVRSQN
jgi:hypothetical protein